MSFPRTVVFWLLYQTPILFKRSAPAGGIRETILFHNARFATFHYFFVLLRFFVSKHELNPYFEQAASKFSIKCLSVFHLIFTAFAAILEPSRVRQHHQLGRGDSRQGRPNSLLEGNCFISRNFIFLFK